VKPTRQIINASSDRIIINSEDGSAEKRKSAIVWQETSEEGVGCVQKFRVGYSSVRTRRSHAQEV
jgi:hypothetical protein